MRFCQGARGSEQIFLIFEMLRAAQAFLFGVATGVAVFKLYRNNPGWSCILIDQMWKYDINV